MNTETAAKTTDEFFIVEVGHSPGHVESFAYQRRSYDRLMGFISRTKWGFWEWVLGYDYHGNSNTYWRRQLTRDKAVLAMTKAYNKRKKLKPALPRPFS